MIIKTKLLGLFLLIFFNTSCSSIVNKQDIVLSLDKRYAISSFWNYTETPMAGLRVATILESVLAQKGLSFVSLIEGAEEIALVKSKEAFLRAKKERAKKMNIDYLITGNVQEWRYKTGIDGEPVVSYNINIIDLKRDNIVFSGVGAKSAWGHKSIGVVAQEIAMELIPKFVKQ